ncbi:DUF4267 domain-containing protein [Streptomyces sp. NBC_00190]|uniref:DUF4267 domain-containing protein n=1 Tax=unclassified Streptomyces TaxID=2593676 RepID=UPI002E2A74BF|nr:DUF4267 domain-containing protein [Streptomyces sp. NBC_00190]WSZ37998.1 DUF4267 domain-containing protein [Streptomyces sp. NBC_00868]
MSLKRTGTVLAALIGAAVIYFGANFLINPHGTAGGLIITPWPHGNATGYFTVKGVRDIASGLVALILLAMGQRRALGCPCTAGRRRHPHRRRGAPVPIDQVALSGDGAVLTDVFNTAWAKVPWDAT